MSLSFTQINTSLCTPTGTPYSLRAMSAAAGFSTPDSASEFIGYVCPTVYQLDISCDGTTNASACSLSMSCTAYSTVQTPVFGTIFYANSALTTLYDFSAYSGIFIKFNSWDNVTGTWKCRIDTFGTAAITNTPSSC